MLAVLATLVIAPVAVLVLTDDNGASAGECDNTIGQEADGACTWKEFGAHFRDFTQTDRGSVPSDAECMDMLGSYKDRHQADPTLLPTASEAVDFLGGCLSVEPGSGASAAPVLSPQEECVAVVTDFLNQLPEALREGYSDGLSMDSLQTEYGVNSAIYRAAIIQYQVIGQISLRGDPEAQVEKVLPEVEQRCASAS